MKIYTTCVLCGTLLWAVESGGRYTDTHPECEVSAGEPAERKVPYVQALEREFLAAVANAEPRKILSLAETLNRASEAPESIPDAARLYTTWGWSVFPLRPGGKEPLPGTNGFKDATHDVTAVRGWERSLPGREFNIGLPTGVLFDVVDVDYRANPGALTAWLGIADQFEVDGIVATPRGTHYYVQPTGNANQAKINGVIGLDYRGVGGYVVAPPSRRVDGRYWWRSTPSPRIKRGNG